MRQLLQSGIFGEFQSEAAYIIGALLCAVIPYIIGSVNFTAMMKPEGGHADIAEIWLAKGPGAALMACLCDGAKGALCAFIGLILMPGDGFAGIAALFCLVGQSFSVFRKFRGGGGGAALVGAALVINPPMGAAALLILVLMVILSHYVSAGVLIFAVAFPFFCDKFPFWSVGFAAPDENIVSVINYTLERLTPFALAFAAFLAYARALGRIINSEEPKILVKSDK